MKKVKLSLAIFIIEFTCGCGSPIYNGPPYYYIDPTVGSVNGTSSHGATYSSASLSGPVSDQEYPFQLQAVPEGAPTAEFLTPDIHFTQALKMTFEVDPAVSSEKRCISMDISIRRGKTALQNFTTLVSTTGQDITDPSDPCRSAQYNPLILVDNQVIDTHLPVQISISVKELETDIKGTLKVEAY
jgi:hypothetical protein